MALANPDPEIAYETAMASRPDIIFATGRSDYPNQVNNVLGFPYIFRGALDVRATKINEAMKLAAGPCAGRPDARTGSGFGAGGLRGREDGVRAGIT